MLKHLTLAEMAAIGLAWVNKGTRRDTFLSIPEIAPLHPQLTSAHKAILAVQPADRSMSPELRALLKKGEIIDMRHDSLARASGLGLELERELCLSATPPDTARAAACDHAHERLFPEGMSVVNVSWLAEAGNAARVHTLLDEDAELRPLLESIVAGSSKKPLLDVVERWIAAGKELDEIELERGELLSKQAQPADKATIQAARSRWIRVVKAILRNLELSTAPAETIEAVRGTVLRASDRAAKRYTTGETDAEVLDPEDSAEAKPT
jgi:hypothetical protein